MTSLRIQRTAPEVSTGRRGLQCYRLPDALSAALSATLSATLLAAIVPACRAQAAGSLEVTAAQRQTAERFTASGIALSELAPDAPASYTVRRGDTLWSLSTLYLRSPWRWPELWGMNLSDVRNPHLIYPGQTLVLVRTDGRHARLALEGGAGAAAAQPPAAPAAGAAASSAAPAAATAAAAPAGAAVAPAVASAAQAAMPAGAPDARLQPRIRDEGAERQGAIPSIPNGAIEPFLSQPMIVGAAELDKMAHIVATSEDHVYLGTGDSAYARGVAPATDLYSVFRAARPLFAADDTARRKPIAFEALYLGAARVVRRGDELATIEITRARQEIGSGDSLLPVANDAVPSFVPHHPAGAVDGRIIDVYGGVDFAGAQSVVTLDRGRHDGLEVGHVLAVLHHGATVEDRTRASHPLVKLPDEQVGLAFVFRAFDSISYALLVSSTGPIRVGDRVLDPDSALARAQAADGTRASP